jgi:hypothetical protein
MINAAFMLTPSSDSLLFVCFTYPRLSGFNINTQLVSMVSFSLEGRLISHLESLVESILPFSPWVASPSLMGTSPAILSVSMRIGLAGLSAQVLRLAWARVGSAMLRKPEMTLSFRVS